MIEEIVIGYLAEKLDVGVYAEVPETMPVSFCIVEKTGGGETDFINSPMIIVQSYADTLYHAAQLNEAVKTAMRGLPYAADVFSCKLNSDYNFTDTTTRRYRYQAVFDITY